MINKFRYAAVLPTLAFALLSGGCGGNEPWETISDGTSLPGYVSMSISMLNGGAPLSRADGVPADPVHPNEKITDWFMVFIDINGEVAKIVSRFDSDTGIGSGAPAVESETFRCQLPAGSYTVYAFANMTQAQLEEAAGIRFAVGAKVNVAALGSLVWTGELNGWNIESAPLPMTGFRKDIVVANTIEEHFSVEVVRMVAKLQLLFTNLAGSYVTVNSVCIDPVTTSAVSLFPTSSAGIGYAHLGNSSFAPLADAIYAPLTFPMPDISVASDSDEAVEASVYFKETVSGRPNDGAFTIGINVSHEGGIAEFQQYNITRYIRDYINRNDWIVIPVELSRYDVSVEALFYPPIGGYPAVISSADPDGSQVFTFSTQGEFSIVPYVVDKLSGTHLAPSSYSIALGEVKGDKIFVEGKSPSVTKTSSALPDEIIGCLSAAKGKAVMYVSVSVGTHMYTRRIYVIRD